MHPLKNKNLKVNLGHVPILQQKLMVAYKKGHIRTHLCKLKKCSYWKVGGKDSTGQSLWELHYGGFSKYQTQDCLW